jgi:hypothetical protein
MIEPERPTRRLNEITSLVHARTVPVIEETRDGFVIQIGDRKVELTKREALDLTVALVAAVRLGR